ncbi:MAG TPA: bifunctional hydroxymethylpyrimidine kinase/phosphomethylpyrimidine kinase [Bacteroidia bacterium]|nr:bifunctional hydroxymethylpyrimidine kinase/phosphomethylpyrimidine kinase [Bacteroidia bacterium]
MSLPIVLTIAGSDSSAGAGIQADLKTFAAHGVYGTCAVTALVAEAPGAVASLEAVDPTLLGLQLNRVQSSFPLSAVKTGMLATGDIVFEVAAFAARHRELPLVIDPVLQAGAGASLLDDEGRDRLKRDLVPLARLVTPNLPEAEFLLGQPLSTAAAFAAAPRLLHKRYGCDFLVKGGHFPGSDSSIVIDHAWIDGKTRTFSRPRLPVPDVHGTGCTLSAAIAARLALGDDLHDAIEAATRYLTACLRAHHRWTGPEGNIEALNHFPDGVE